MARDQIDMTPLQSRDELVAWLEAGVKSSSEFRIGTEHEKTPFTLQGHDPVPYEGSRGIGALLEGMQLLLGWEPIMEQGNIIGLYDVTGGGAISLELEGQFELFLGCAGRDSASDPIRACGASGAGQGDRDAARYWISRARHDALLVAGADPYDAKGPLQDYERLYAEGRPTRPRHDVSNWTAKTNLDFSSETDMVKKLRVSVALQPVATALFANSPFTEGKPNGFLSFRSEIWRDTDNARAGMIPWAFEDGMGFDAGSTMRSTCRCILSSAAKTISTYPVPRFVIFSTARTRVPRRASDPFGLGQSPVHTSRKCGSSVIWKCAAPTACRGAGCRHFRRSGSGCSTTTPASTRRGTSSSAGPRRTSGVARRRPSLGIQGPDQGSLSVPDRQGIPEAVPWRLAAARASTFRPRRSGIWNRSTILDRDGRGQKRCWRNSTAPGPAPWNPPIGIRFLVEWVA